MRVKKNKAMERNPFDDNFGAPPQGLEHNAILSDDLRRESQEQREKSAKTGFLDTLRSSRRSGITPYLGLQSRLSQIWFNRWTILLLLVLVRVLLLLASLNDDLNDAQAEALSACTKVEDVGSAMASMPHYLSVGVNSLAASGITDAVHGLMDILDMILTGVEALILFVINMMTSTYTCLIAAAVHGGLNVSAVVVTDATNAFNSGIRDITSDITNVAQGIQSTIDKIYSAANSVTGFLTGSNSLPTEPKIDFSGDVDKLNNLQINSSGFVADLVNINNELPTFQDIQNLTNQAVSFPFNLVKTALNNSYGNYAFDSSIFPVAQKQALTFCSDNSVISNFFAELFEIARIAKIVFIVALVVLAILACIPMAYLEIRRWRKIDQYTQMFNNRKFDDLDLVYMASRPLTSRFAIRAADKLGIRDEKKQVLFRWCVAYGTSLPAIFVLSLAIAGLFSCLCQFIILKAVQKEIPALADQVGDFAQEVVTTLDNVSVQWANDANGVLLSFQNDINNDVLGYVVNATSAVNDTLNVFTDGLSQALNLAFNNTVLKDPIEDVVYCLIGLKVASVEKGLTWVNQNAHVTLPLFPNDTFSEGAAKSINGDSDLTSFLATPGTVTSDDITSAIVKVTDAIQNNIIKEALVSAALLLVYIIVVLVGVVSALLSVARPSQFDRTRGRFTGDGRKFPFDGPETAHPDAGFDEYDDANARSGAVRAFTTEKPTSSHTRSSSYGFVGNAKS